MINELNLVNIVSESLGLEARAMAAGTQSATEADLNYNGIRFVLISILYAPNSKLIVANSCSNLNQMLGNDLVFTFLFDSFVEISNLAYLIKMLYVESSQLFFELRDLKCIDVHGL